MDVDIPKTLKLTCPRCGFANAARVLASGKSFSKPLELTITTSYFVECGACDREFLVDDYVSLQSMDDLDVKTALIRGQSHPKFAWKKCHPIENFPNSPSDVPEEVGLLYREAAAALLSGFPNAAGMLFGKLLETATRTASIVSKMKTEEPEKYRKMWLKKRLQILKSEGIVPPALSELVDVIKDERDEAVHGFNSYTIEEASELKRFVDLFLEIVFSVPARLAAAKQKNLTR
jgi:predicted nucleic-acid-binding Zn-ribbon protein